MSPNTSDGTFDCERATEEGARFTAPAPQIRRELLSVLTQETRFTLIQNIVAHPEQLPSLKELDYYNPSKSKSTIRNHLETLIDHGLVEERTLCSEERSRDLPWKFYGITKITGELLQGAGLLDAEGTLREMYDLLELTEDIERYAAAPRPEKKSQTTRLGRTIRAAKSNTQSVEDQIEIVRSMYDTGVDLDHHGVTASELNGSCSVETADRLRTSLTHLEEIGLIETVSPVGPDVFAISERLDEIINGRVQEVASADLANLLAHMEDELYAVDLDDVQRGAVVALTDGAGTTIRSILADEFGIARNEVETYLQTGDPVEKLNAAVDAIEANDRLSSEQNYGRIVFRRPVNRYRLTAAAVELLEEQTNA